MDSEDDTLDENESQYFLGEMLNKLYDLGGDILEESEQKRTSKSKRETQKHRQKIAESRATDHSKEQPEHSTSRSKAKKCRKSVAAFFKKLKDEQLLHADYVCGEAINTNQSTLSTLAKKPEEKKVQVEVVTFLDPSKKKKSEPESTQSANVETSLEVNKKSQEEKTDTQVFNLEEKARLEVHRFGITGYKMEKQRMFEQERAIMLGAKPPKPEYVNYKTYQDNIRQKKMAVTEKVELETKSDIPKRKRRKEQEDRRTQKKKSGDFLPTGQVGTFRNGTLILSTKDIKKIKSSKMRK
uniref:Chromosome 1 open reading frame 131 n=1 Tax=Latimeria chalumnae TaxID=7897 RepID=H3B912_LATCH